jgi:hypothetical protein
MLKTGLEFAPGTTDDSKRLIHKLLTPESILTAYRTARSECRTGDIVLHMSDQDPIIRGGTRIEFCKHLQERFGKAASGFRMWQHSAHAVMKLPKDSEALWLVIEANGLDVPVMCVIYATPYEQTAAAPN